MPLSVLARKVGDEKNTRFWLDSWIGDRPLCKQFPRLAALEMDLSCLVADRWSQGGWVWQWRRSFEGGMSHSQLDTMLGLLNSFSCSQSKDVWNWTLEDDGVFTVGGTRRSIDSKVLPVSLVQTRWNKWLPSKVNIYIWRLRLGRIPTTRKLSEKGIAVGSTLCPVCGAEQETIEHLFFQCNVADAVWHLVYNWLQVQIGVVHDVAALFDWVDGMQVDARKRKMVDVVVCTTLWFLWRFRNDVVHEAGLIRKSVLFDSIREFSFCWVSNRQKRLLVNWTSWLQFPLNFL